jgi:dihydrofolate reductase
MAKLILSMFTSLDGYIERPNGEFAPPAWSDDVARNWSAYALARAGHLVYGRTNFLFNKKFWPTAEDDADGPSHARTMNSLPKTVFSTTLTGDPGWNARLATGDVVDEIAALKAGTDGDVFSFGGAGMANSLVRHDLVDEYRLMIVPELYGDGKPLFEPGRRRLALKLTETIQLDTGAVILRYVRDRT